jgi:hypothetical protein
MSIARCGISVSLGSLPDMASLIRLRPQGEAQTRIVDNLTTEEFVNTNPGVARGCWRMSNFYEQVN